VILFRTEDDELVDLEKITFINIQYDRGNETYWIVANFNNKCVNLDGFQYRCQAKEFIDKIVGLLENKFDVIDYYDL